MEGERGRAAVSALVGFAATVAFLAGPDAVLGAVDWFFGSSAPAADAGPSMPTVDFYRDWVRPVLPLALTLGGVVLCGVTALLVVFGVAQLVQVLRQRQRLRSRGAVVSAAQRQRARWEEAEASYNEVREAYAAYAADAVRVSLGGLVLLPVLATVLLVPGIYHLWAAATWDVPGGSWGMGIALSTIGVLALPAFAVLAWVSAPRCTRCRWPAARHRGGSVIDASR